MKSTYRLSINSLYWFAVVVQATMNVGGVLSIKPEQTDRKVNLLHRGQFKRGSADECILIVGKFAETAFVFPLQTYNKLTLRFWQTLTNNHMTETQVMVIPVQVVGGLVQECVILSDKLSPDQLGTWLLHHHFFGQLEISARRRGRG